jgi:hypothetical protein
MRPAKRNHQHENRKCTEYAGEQEPIKPFFMRRFVLIAFGIHGQAHMRDSNIVTFVQRPAVDNRADFSRALGNGWQAVVP